MSIFVESRLKLPEGVVCPISTGGTLFFEPGTIRGVLRCDVDTISWSPQDASNVLRFQFLIRHQQAGAFVLCRRVSARVMAAFLRRFWLAPPSTLVDSSDAFQLVVHESIAVMAKDPEGNSCVPALLVPGLVTATLCTMSRPFGPDRLSLRVVSATLNGGNVAHTVCDAIVPDILRAVFWPRLLLGRDLTSTISTPIAAERLEYVDCPLSNSFRVEA